MNTKEAGRVPESQGAMDQRALRLLVESNWEKMSRDCPPVLRSEKNTSVRKLS